MYLNTQDKEMLKGHIINDMTLRSRWMAKTFEDDDASDDFLIALIHKHYKKAFNMICTFGCVRFEVELVWCVMIKCNISAVIQLNDFNLKDQVDNTSELFDAAVLDYNTSCEQLADLIFGAV